MLISSAYYLVLGCLAACCFSLYTRQDNVHCSTKHSCSNTTIILDSNGTIYGGGYQSLNGIKTKIISAKNNSNINCDGAESCKQSAMLSLSQSFSDDGTIYQGINCHGFQSCQKSYSESDTLIACLGDKSCQDAIISAKYLITCDGAFSCQNSIIYAPNRESAEPRTEAQKSEHAAFTIDSQSIHPNADIMNQRERRSNVINLWLDANAAYALYNAHIYAGIGAGIVNKDLNIEYDGKDDNNGNNNNDDNDNNKDNDNDVAPLYVNETYMFTITGLHTLYNATIHCFDYQTCHISCLDSACYGLKYNCSKHAKCHFHNCINCIDINKIENNNKNKHNHNHRHEHRVPMPWLFDKLYFNKKIDDICYTEHALAFEDARNRSDRHYLSNKWLTFSKKSHVNTICCLGRRSCANMNVLQIIDTPTAYEKGSSSDDETDTIDEYMSYDTFGFLKNVPDEDKRDWGLFCLGYGSCASIQSMTIMVQGKDKEKYANYNIYCNGLESCRDTSITTPYDVFCGSFGSCMSVTLYNASHLYCSGTSSCYNMRVFNVRHVYLLASWSGTGMKIYSDERDINVYVTSWNFNHGNTVIMCEPGDTCYIECKSYGACKNVEVNCWGHCNIYCNQTGDWYCPEIKEESKYYNVTYIDEPYSKIENSWVEIGSDDDYVYNGTYEKYGTNGGYGDNGSGSGSRSGGGAGGNGDNYGKIDNDRRSKNTKKHSNMMIIVVVISLFIGLVTGIGVYNLIQRRKESQAKYKLYELVDTKDDDI